MVTFNRKDLLDLISVWKRKIQEYHNELHRLRELNAEKEGKLSTEIYGLRKRLHERNLCLEELEALKKIGEDDGN